MLYRLEVKTGSNTFRDIVIECPNIEIAEEMVADIGGVGYKLGEIVTLITEDPKHIKLTDTGEVSNNDTILRYHHITNDS